MRHENVFDEGSRTNFLPHIRQGFMSESYVKKPYSAFGEGTDGWVYCYYFPYIRELVEANKGSKWPCKIGCTQRKDSDGNLLGAEVRIAEQIYGTSTFEPPEIGFHAKSESAADVEAKIHVLLNPKKYENDYGSGLGTEWFLVSLYDVRKAYREVMYPKLHMVLARLALMVKMELQSWGEGRKRSLKSKELR